MRLDGRLAGIGAWPVILLMGIAAFGCAIPSGIFFREKTAFSLDASGRPEPQAPMAISLGYRRSILAVVPEIEVDPERRLICPESPVATGEREAQSLVSVFSLGPTNTSNVLRNDLLVRNNFATGRAAIALTCPRANGEAGERVKTLVEAGEEEEEAGF